MLDTKDRMAIHLKRLHKPRSCCRLMECASILGIPFEVRFRSKDDLCRVFSSLVKVLSPRSIVGLWDVGRIIGRSFKRGRTVRPDAPPTAMLVVEIQPLRAPSISMNGRAANGWSSGLETMEVNEGLAANAVIVCRSGISISS